MTSVATGRMGGMRVLVGPRQVRRHPDRGRGGARRSPPAGARHAPDDELDLAPMADGGPGFVDVLHAALGGELLAVTVAGPFGEPVPGDRAASSATTAYVESAQACGLHLTRRRARRGGHDASAWASWSLAARRRRRRARSSSGSAAAAPTTAAPACWPRSARPPTAPLDAGAARPRRRAQRRPRRRPRRLGGVDLVAASDVDNPLTGLFGATKTFGPQKGVAEERIAAVDGWLEAFAAATDRRTSLEKGAGAAGGLGLRAARCSAPPARPGIDLVADAVGLAERARAADLVVTGEGAFDFSSRSGKVPYGVAADRRRGRCGRAWRWPGRCWSAPARCAPSASSRRTPWSTWWGRSGPSASPAAALADARRAGRPHLVPLTLAGAGLRRE